MKCEILMNVFFILENKSLTNVGEFWEVKSWTAVGDEEYAHLQTLFWNFCAGDSCCLRRTLLGNVEISMESVDFFLGKRVQEAWLLVALLGSRSWTDLWSDPGFTVTYWEL